MKRRVHLSAWWYLLFVVCIVLCVGLSKILNTYLFDAGAILLGIMFLFI